jgi:hypothetical protein
MEPDVVTPGVEQFSRLLASRRASGFSSISTVEDIETELLRRMTPAATLGVMHALWRQGDESSFFVLLDLPWFCILEYDFRVRLIAIHHSDHLRPDRHYRRLNATEETNGIRFATVAEDGTGPRTIVEALLRRP